MAARTDDPVNAKAIAPGLLQVLQQVVDHGDLGQ